MRFDSTAQENHFDASTTDATLLTATAAADVDDYAFTDGDGVSQTVSIADNEAFSLSAGTWNIFFYARGIIGTNNNVFCYLYTVNSGTDDREIQTAFMNNESESDNNANSLSIKYDYFALTATTQFYILFGSLAATSDNIAGYLQLERLI